MMGSPCLSAEVEKVYTFGVVPQYDARRTQSIWHPILEQLAQLTGYKFVLRGSATIPAFEREFLAGEFDFAYMNPYHVILSQKSVAYQPLVRDVGKTLYGIIVVPKNSAISTVQSLANAKMAFPAPNALAASMLIRSELKKKHNIDVVANYVQTHSSVYLNVALGDVVAGGGVQKTLSQQPQEIRDSLRILYRTGDVAPHPIAAHSKISADVQLKVQDALMNISRTENGKKLLEKIPVNKLGQASIEDYRILKDMDLEKFFQHW